MTRYGQRVVSIVTPEATPAGVRAPTLLIVGSDDPVVLDPKRRARALLGCESRLEIVEGARHLFEEPGTLEEAARLATAWFRRWL